MDQGRCCWEGPGWVQDSEGGGTLVGSSSWGRKESSQLSDWTTIRVYTPFIWPQVVFWRVFVVLEVTPWPFLRNEECFKELTFSICWGFQLCRRLQRYCSVYPLGQNQDPRRGCTVLSWLLLLCLCGPSCPWLAPLSTCSWNSGKAVKAEWNLCPTNKKDRTQKGLHARSPAGSCSISVIEYYHLTNKMLI